jgi:cytochrome oxidase Cu insertion factor (SCO1/SenC/PrrC family)
MNAAVRPEVRRARRRLVLLFVVFALPVAIAYALYFSGWRPETAGNYGELVQPPRPLPDLTLTTLEGGTLRLEALRGRWSLVIFAAASCPKPCEVSLDKVHRVILAQGENAGRVRPVLVVTDARAADWLYYAIKDYPGTLVLLGPPPAVRALATHFELAPGASPEGFNRLYLVDPLGNFMLSWPADADANRMRKDLARLLRVSRVG